MNLAFTMVYPAERKTTYSWGVVYLFLYNLAFGLPLVIILLSLGKRMIAKRVATWEREHALKILLWYGLVMLALGAIILLWVI